MYLWVSAQSVLRDVLKLKSLGLRAPEPPTARTSGDCDQTQREKETSGYAGLEIFKGLWQNRASENKVQLWLIYAVL